VGSNISEEHTALSSTLKNVAADTFKMLVAAFPSSQFPSPLTEGIAEKGLATAKTACACAACFYSPKENMLCYV
jgi:hypothetical protein